MILMPSTMSLFRRITNKTVWDQIARDLIITVQTLSLRESAYRLSHHLPFSRTRTDLVCNYSKINTFKEEINERLTNEYN